MSIENPEIIGVTGHRMNALTPARAMELEEDIRNVLIAICGARAEEMTLITALAEGADRIAAASAMQTGMKIHALLPFPRDAYEADFQSAASKETFHTFLKHAAKITELPARRGTPGDDARAYAACGEKMIGMCDLLIAVWDGQDGRGAGGTNDVISMALTADKPVIWFDSRTRVMPTLITAMPDGGRRLEPLAPG